MLRWCERQGVYYLVGLAKNERLNALSAKLQKRAYRKYQKTGSKMRLFTQFQYKAKTWDKKRRVIAKAEHSERGANPRYVVTNLDGASQVLCDHTKYAPNPVVAEFELSTPRAALLLPGSLLRLSSSRC